MNRIIEIDEELLHRLYINCGLFYESVKDGKVPTRAEIEFFYNTLVEIHQVLSVKEDGVASEAKRSNFWKTML